MCKCSLVAFNEQFRKQGANTHLGNNHDMNWKQGANAHFCRTTAITLSFTLAFSHHVAKSESRSALLGLLSPHRFFDRLP